MLRFFGLLRNSDEVTPKWQSNVVDMYSGLAGTVVVGVLRRRPDCGGNEVGDSWSAGGGLRRVFLEEDRGGRGGGGVRGYGL